jgi:tryptophan synthase beta chain
MTYFRSDSRGYFGDYGGAFVPEILAAEIARLAREFDAIGEDEAFFAEYARILADFSCRPTPLTYAANLTEKFGTARIYLKREDLNQTGSHKLNNVVGQGLLAKRLGKRRVIAETGAGQHGVATATMAAKLGLECVIYMGAKDVARQRPNVFWMEKLGAKVISVTDGNQTLKDSVNAAFKDWTGSFADTHYVLGTACGPHPFPEMVARFQAIIGTEAATQILARE